MELKFMDNVKSDNYYLNKINKDLRFICLHMAGVSIKELQNNEILLDSMLFRLIQVSENSKKLSIEFKNDNSNIPWNDIYGLRNRIST